jgi:hypothetical protein
MAAKQLRAFGASLSGKQDQINELIDRHSLIAPKRVWAISSVPLMIRFSLLCFFAPLR